jgi:hypothetical protein
MSKPPKPNLRAVFEQPEAKAPASPAATRSAAAPRSAGKKDSHPGKKPVLIHIPETMHKDLRRLALEEGTPLTQITERLLREFLVTKGYTQHAPR